MWSTPDPQCGVVRELYGEIEPQELTFGEEENDREP
jgi:hypothetical protein